MKSYALLIGIPLALLIQHLYEITVENFSKKIYILKIGTIIVIPLLSAWAWIDNWFNTQICVELATISIGTSFLSIYIHKLDRKLELDNFQFHEGVFSCIWILFGIMCCIFQRTSYFDEMSLKICNHQEMILSKILYIICGNSYIFYNRLFICMIYKYFSRNDGSKEF